MILTYLLKNWLSLKAHPSTMSHRWSGLGKTDWNPGCAAIAGTNFVSGTIWQVGISPFFLWKLHSHWCNEKVTTLHSPSNLVGWTELLLQLLQRIFWDCCQYFFISSSIQAKRVWNKIIKFKIYQKFNWRILVPYRIFINWNVFWQLSNSKFVNIHSKQNYCKLFKK